MKDLKMVGFVPEFGPNAEDVESVPEFRSICFPS
jgi:hypothetical protein